MLTLARAQLLTMLTYCRPAGSTVESAFINLFIAPLDGAYQDTHGNWHVAIGESPILWSCHTDTVHNHAGYQTIHFNPQTSVVTLSRRSRARQNCLGADDTAGVWLCLQMIRAGVAGHYIFHYGEENGTIGSSAMSMDRWHGGIDLLERFTYAIALDRHGTRDVITHQFGRCASDAFAWSLADQLNMHGLHYRPAPGIYTDTANYADTIAECSNLSVGYWDEHRRSESLDCSHLDKLLYALVRIDPALLVAERTPAPTWTNHYCQEAFNDLTRSDDWASTDDVNGNVVDIDRYRNRPALWEFCESCGDTFELMDDQDVLCDDCVRLYIQRGQKHGAYLDAEYGEVLAALDADTDDNDDDTIELEITE